MNLPPPLHSLFSFLQNFAPWREILFGVFA